MPDYTNEELIASAKARAAARGGRPRGGTRVAMGDNRHHALLLRIRTDEILFNAGLMQRSELHPDCQPGEIVSGVRLAREFISLAGGTPPPIDQPLQIVTRALGTTDFPHLLENLAAKAATLGYSYAPEVWPLITKQTTTKDYKQFARVTAAELPPPPAVGENGELTQVKLGNDSSEKASAQSYAQLMSISRQAVINDELNRIAITFNEAGRSVARGVGDAVFAILTGNAAMSDGHNLFDANNHGNVGTGGAPSVTTLDELNGKMMAQTGPSGQVLNIRPRYVVAAPTLQSTLAVLRAAINSNDPGDLSTGKIVTLTDGRLTGAPWYVIADPLISSGIEVVVPETGSALRFERRASVETDSLHFLVGADYAVMAVDFRALAYNAGA